MTLWPEQVTPTYSCVEKFSRAVSGPHVVPRSGEGAPGAARLDGSGTRRQQLLRWQSSGSGETWGETTKLPQRE